MLNLRDLSKTYANGVHALKDVSLSIPRGMFGLLGPNGAGKSSLMRTLATLQEADSGSATMDDGAGGTIDMLRDNDRARVVGSRTFGKGSVQTALPLDNGDTVKLTTARYYPPDGTSIQALGIQPDVVLQPDEETDGHPARVSEAVLAGHLDAEGEVVAELEPGNVLEGQAPIDAALAELKRMTSVAVTNRTG